MLDQVLGRVSLKRLWHAHQRLATYGATAKGGVNRQALSEEEAQAREQLILWGTELGLMPMTDAIGNFFLRLEGMDCAASPVLLGSHIDSQPTGGKYDGAFGVLAGLEVLRAIRETGVRPQRSIEVVAWMNEEGSRFAPGMMGSAAFSGARALRDLVEISDAAELRVADELDRMRRRFPEVIMRELGFAVHCYLEAHIEQGPVLEREAKTIGVVTAIQGKRTYRVEVQGEEAHAGTTPRAARRDALMSAIRIVLALDEKLHDSSDTTRFTVGRLSVYPNAPSVVPSRVSFSIDVRHPQVEVIDHYGAIIPALCNSTRGPCVVSCHELVNDPPVTFSEMIQDRIAETCRRLGIPHRSMPSAAGHDAKHLVPVCATGMIFVPCKGGISHNEVEDVNPEDLYQGTKVLCEVACREAGIDGQ